MEEMMEGARIHIRRDGTFDAEVIMNREVVWRSAGYRTQNAAQQAASQQLGRLKQRG
jgi:dsRNA-specific ribonuclease